MSKTALAFILGGLLFGGGSIAYAVSAFPIATGGTAASTFLQGLVYSPGGTNALIATSSGLTLDHIIATSTSATSTYAAGLQAKALNITGTTASSTFANGIQLSAGCIQMPSGTCLAAGGSGSVTSIAFGDALNGGTITTSGSVNLKSYFASSTAESAGQIAYANSTNGWPLKLSFVGTSTPSFAGYFAYSGTLGNFINGASGSVTLNGIASISQGDLIYGSGANTWTALAKNASATRYLSNTGASNNPAWAQIDLTSGVTGTLPIANGGLGITSGTAGQILYWPGTTANGIAMVASSSQTLSSAFSDSGTFGADIGGSSGTISSVISQSFTYSTSTTWTGTTTIPLEQVILASTVNAVKCSVYPLGTATLNIQYGIGTASTTMLTASSTNNLNVVTANNTLSVGNRFTVDIGTPANTPTKINCTVKKTI